MGYNQGRNSRFILNVSTSTIGALSSQGEIPVNYEKQIQKLESDIRNHIRVE